MRPIVIRVQPQRVERQIEHLLLYALEGRGEKSLEALEVEPGQRRLCARETRVQCDRLLVKRLGLLETRIAMAVEMLSGL